MAPIIIVVINEDKLTVPEEAYMRQVAECEDAQTGEVDWVRLTEWVESHELPRH